MLKNFLVYFIVFNFTLFSIKFYAFSSDIDKLLENYQPKSNLITSTVIGNESFSNLEDSINLKDYKLSSGDSIDIHFWNNQLNLVYNFTIPPDNKIFIPQLGTININNITILELENLLNKKIKSIGKNTNITVILKKTKNLKIYISGQVKNPGIYTTSYGIKLSEVIKLAGGVLENGSLRNISVVCKNKKYTVDLYNFLYYGNLNSNPSLKEDTQIIVPLKQKKVALLGKVVNPGIYEIKDNETFKELLFYAGGILPQGSLKGATLWTNGLLGDYENSEKVNFLKSNEFKLQDNYIIFIPEYKAIEENKLVYLHGQLKKTGPFNYKVGYRLSDYINLSGGFTDLADLSNTLIIRANQVQTVDLYKLIYQGNKELDVEILENDIIYVPEKFFNFRNFNEITNLALTVLGITSIIVNIVRK